MSDLAAALASSERLSSYKGRDVLNTAISIRNAGDGLSEAMAIDPEELEIGTTVYVVLECEVDKHTHAPIKEAPDCLTLKQVLKAGTATLVDASLVSKLLNDQAEKIRRAKEDAAGVNRLPYGDELQAQHDEGKHTELVDDCPSCDAEREADEREAKQG